MINENTPNKSLFVGERHNQIVEWVNVRGRVRLAELVELFGVSEPTIRKDLTTLEERGLLKRTHGGAIGVRSLVDSELETRMFKNAEARKERDLGATLALLLGGVAKPVVQRFGEQLAEQALNADPATFADGLRRARERTSQNGRNGASSRSGVTPDTPVPRLVRTVTNSSKPVTKFSFLSRAST